MSTTLDPKFRPLTYDEAYGADGEQPSEGHDESDEQLSPLRGASAGVRQTLAQVRGNDSPSARLVVTPASAITPTAPSWRWRGWLVAGAVHLGIGRQGSGKTTFGEWLVAMLTTGTPWPGEEVRRDPLRCGLLSLEEPADRLVARLHAAGANVERVTILRDVEVLDDERRRSRRPWRLPGDCAALEDAITTQRLAFVVIDGLGYSIAGDSHNYANVGSALAALAAVAERTGCSVLGLTHPPKGASDPVTAGIGSTAWTAIPRITWVLGFDPEDATGQRRVVRVGKTNYVEPAQGWSFSIRSDEQYEAGYVSDVTPSTVTAAAITGPTESADERGKRGEAQRVVEGLLRNGPLRVADLNAAAEAAGVSKRTVERARRDIGAVSTPRSDPATGRVTDWIVALPDQPAIPVRQTAAGGVGGPETTRGNVAPSGPDRRLSAAGSVGAVADDATEPTWPTPDNVEAPTLTAFPDAIAWCDGCGRPITACGCPAEPAGAVQ
ncbi:MAG: AAA family ATPase [Acidimicrobiales bacterium]